jgi:two-component system cell cycle sensor histidine kinase/response regulator CckA
MRELASMIQETFPKEIRIEQNLDPDLPAIHADPNQLHQAFLNLAINARDAMPQGGTLSLETRAVSGESLRDRHPNAPAQSYVEATVSDTGSGMDAETRRHIFEPFFTTKGASGQGLGLAAIYGIVNGHQGLIELETEPGEGTSFKLYFAVPPESVREEQPAARAKQAEERAPAAVQAERTGNSQTLLLVEDEEMLLKPTQAMLEEEGFEVLIARDGIEAVAKHAENAGRISAVVLDLGLPRLSGWQAYLQMREREPGLRCIVASGNIDKERRQSMKNEGISASLRKPYSASEMLEIVRQVLAGPAA